MINIQRFVVNLIGENCYVVSDETNEAVMIDCGAYSQDEEQEISRYISDNALILRNLICTHAHFDHILGDMFVFGHFHLNPMLHPADMWLYDNVELQIRNFLHKEIRISMPDVGAYIYYGDVISFGHHHLKAIATPGHTPGGLSFYCKEESLLFSGDSLFSHSIGRTDFPYGDEDALIRSLKENVMTLPNETVILPGHGGPTTVREEKAMNPFLQ